MMTCFGLAPDHAAKVLLDNASKSDASFDFTSYALVGLRNFYKTFPDKFLSRVAKGPPP